MEVKKDELYLIWTTKMNILLHTIFSFLEPVSHRMQIITRYEHADMCLCISQVTR